VGDRTIQHRKELGPRSVVEHEEATVDKHVTATGYGLRATGYGSVHRELGDAHPLDLCGTANQNVLVRGQSHREPRILHHRHSTSVRRTGVDSSAAPHWSFWEGSTRRPGPAGRTASYAEWSARYGLGRQAMVLLVAVGDDDVPREMDFRLGSACPVRKSTT